MEDLGSFVKQVPPAILLAPLVFGALYIGLTVFIIRRASKRRRLQREAKQQVLQQMSGSRIPMENFLSGELPNKPLRPAEWTVPAELRDLPEPDLDVLANPVLLEDMPEDVPQDMPEATPLATMAEAAAVPASVAAPLIAEPDWIAAVVPPQEAADTEKPAGGTMDSKPDGSVSGDAVEVMRVWRDLSDGTLIIQMGNQRYRTLSDIKNPDLARRFMAVVRELWAMVNAAPSRAPSAQPAPTNGSGAALPEAPLVAAKPRMGLLKTEYEPPKQGMFNQLTRDLKQNPNAVPEPPPTGIAGAVEEFLQFKLSNTPQYATRSIHIRPSHNQGLTIEVDGHFYEAIGDVIDPDVREFLFALMREWEARH
ncbi:MAG: hypothetical protein IT324_27680 [Anaerolineae bacterium]|nr:hypothetical protein [Anaerolineae bacterium]